MRDFFKRLVSLKKHENTNKAEPVSEALASEPAQSYLKAETEKLIQQMVSKDSILSPVAGIVHRVSVTDNQIGIVYESRFGLALTFPASMADKAAVLVKDGQQVEAGTPLFQVDPSLLSKLSLDVIHPGVIPGFADIKTNILRIM